MVVNGFKIWTYEQIKEDKDKFEEVFDYIRMYGVHCMAYSILQPKMNYFIIDGIGIVAYGKLGPRGKTRYVLGDPLVARDNTEILLSMFLEVFPNSCFLQTSERVALILNKIKGMFMTIFGTETFLKNNGIKNYKLDEIRNEISNMEVELAILENEKDKLYLRINESDNRKEFWHVKKKVHKLRENLKNLKVQAEDEEEKGFLYDFLSNEGRGFLRREYTLAEKEGLIVNEADLNNINLDLLEAISNEWIKNNTMTKTENGFLTRPFIRESVLTNGRRLFIVKKANETIGFLELFPLYQNDKVVGYYADIIRTIKTIPHGTVNFLLLNAADKIFKEGYEIYSLGLSPFHKTAKFNLEGESKRKDNPISTFIFKTVFDYGSFLYNAKGQAFHKERYRANTDLVFYCSNKTVPIGEVIGGFGVCGIKII